MPTAALPLPTTTARLRGKPKGQYFLHHSGDLKRRLAEALPREELRDLHRVRAWRHFLTAGRLFASVLVCGWALWQDQWKTLWAPAAVLQGFNLLGFIILVHEAIHKLIFKRSRPRAERALGRLYAAMTGISSAQFAIWHLDHHAELGHAEDDPKRAHLSPKRNSRWVKLLYLTPALFVVYGRGSAREAATYPQETQRAIRTERRVNQVFHLALIAALLIFGGGWVLLRVYAIPLFFCFPPAFVLNRLGQHYDIDPTDPARWTTLVNGNSMWHFLFLWSNFHVEHHFFQRVPFYNLKRLNRALQPFYRDVGLENRTYLRMLWGWFVLNKVAHTDWREPEHPSATATQGAA